MRPPGLGGVGLEDRFDVVLTANGLEDFATEYAGSRAIIIDGVEVRVLPLARVLKSKQAANRPKDRAQIPALEAALTVERDSER
jgi:Flp pilus assembly protein CpaB